jgi:hypothetical protein
LPTLRATDGEPDNALADVRRRLDPLARIHDLNGNLLGKLAAGDGSLPILFKNLVEANRPIPSAH